MSPYEVAVDTSRHTIHVTMRGFWDRAITQGYIAELKAAARRVAPAGTRSWWLIDISDGTLQSQETTDMMRDSLRDLHPAGSIVAVVTPGALHTMQAKRVVDNGTHRYFTTLAAAEAWLDEQDRPA